MLSSSLSDACISATTDSLSPPTFDFHNACGEIQVKFDTVEHGEEGR